MFSRGVLTVLWDRLSAMAVMQIAHVPNPLAAENNLNLEGAEKSLCPAQPTSEYAGSAPNSHATTSTSRFRWQDSKTA
jgi:hypothetical protein